MDFRQRYFNLNNSFQKKLVFRIGCNAGFFSEYNNMILAMLYCLNHKIQFVLYSKKSNFSYNKGWEDFFLPFCQESLSFWHLRYNNRPGRKLQKKQPIAIKIFKKLGKIDYLTQDLWGQFYNEDFGKNEIFDFPQLKIKGSLLEVCHILINMTWRYNEHTNENIQTKIRVLNLPENYIGFHIRSGDKFVENELFDGGCYLQKAEKITDIRNAFILTDDYKIIEDIQEKFPYWNIWSLCGERERGYFHSTFSNQSENEKKEAHLRLFASMDILANANKFIGTFSSNPGMYMGMRVPQEKCYGIDRDEWLIW